MEPVGTQIDGVPSQGNRHGPAADAATRLQHAYAQACRDELSRGADAGGSRADDRHIHFSQEIRRRRFGQMHRILHPSPCEESVHK
jgi:hypothetical protein